MTDPQTLLTQAKCYLCLGVSLAEALELALLAQVVGNGGGGGGGGTQQVYSSDAADPNALPILPVNQSIANFYYQTPSVKENNIWYWDPELGEWVKTGVGQQVITTNAADPNVAAIAPPNTALGAVYYQDPSITLFNEWKWSPINNTWIQTIAP